MNCLKAVKSIFLIRWEAFMNNILDNAGYTCSGCGACYAVCPVKAISLKINEYGFYSAVVNGDKCISCGLCKSVCARYDEVVNGNSLLNCDLYALKSADNETVQKSSSGGIAGELARYGVNNGYGVTGVTYDLERNIACHKTTIENVSIFRGSKYLQSDTSCFREAIKKKGYIFGTPCQISGLHKVLSNIGKRDDFILVEIFCHGIPSYKLWEEELKRIKSKLGSDQLDDLQFRFKKNNWHMYCIRAEKNGKVYHGEREKDLFWQIYFEDMLLSEACYKCRFRRELSFADLRLGDYWGNKHSNDSEGVSAVFCLTNRGRKIVEELIHTGKVKEMEKTSNEEMLKYQNMQGYTHDNLHRETLELLKANDDFDKVVKYYYSRLPLKKKIKRILIKTSGVIPGEIRYKVKKAIKQS